jgi:hypothetical protein
MTIVIFYLLSILVVLMVFELRHRLRKDQWPQLLPSVPGAKPGESLDTSKGVPVALPSADSQTRVSKHRQAA